MAINVDADMGILAKALKLLHSVEEDSSEQLRIMLEETIKSKYGTKKPINLIGFGLNKKSVADDAGKNKRMKIEESTVSSAMYSRETRSSDSDSDGGVALEILDDDLSCVVCGEMAVGAGNNLVECVECHSLYHQECHNPPILQDVNDPRFVWYCSNCSKTINKVGSNSAKVSSSSSGHSSKSSKSSSKSSSSSTKSFNTFSTSSKTSSSVSSSKHSSSSSSSSAKHNPVPVPKINITADKRLQIMKKNAAKKQEKRKLTK